MINLNLNPSEMISSNLGKDTKGRSNEKTNQKGVHSFSDQLNNKSNSKSKAAGMREDARAEKTFNRDHTEKRSSFKQTPNTKEYKSRPQSSKAPQNKYAPKASLKPASLGPMGLERESGAKRIVDPLQERIAMQQFLGNMKKINVNAEEIINAFSNLTPEQLAASPEDNMNLIVGQFGLEGAEQEQARKHFIDMLNGTDLTQTKEYLGSGKNQRQFSLSLLSQRELNKNKVEKSIDDMNQAFFVNQQGSSVEKDLDAANLNQMKGLQKPVSQDEFFNYQTRSAQTELSTGTEKRNSLQGMSLTQDENPSATVFPMKSGQGLQNTTYQTNQQVLQNQQTPQQDTFFPKNGNVDTQTFEASDQVMRTQGQGLESRDQMFVPQQLNVSKMEMTPATQNYAETSTFEGMSVSGPLESLSFNGNSSSESSLMDDSSSMSDLTGAELSAMDDTDSTGEESFDSLVGARAEGTPTSQQEISNKIKTFLPESQASEEDVKANIDSIVSRTNAIAKKGGGEMKIQMNPEGLGELHLKVAVKDGAVNVEMLTESDGAKKLLERGMGDLKASLAGHKLSVEELKVDISNNLSDFLEKQEQEKERNLAQQFLGDFRRQNDNFRQSFFRQGLAGYKDQTGNDSDSGKIQAMQQAQAKSKGESNRRLNLVA